MRKSFLFFFFYFGCRWNFYDEIYIHIYRTTFRVILLTREYGREYVCVWNKKRKKRKEKSKKKLRIGEPINWQKVYKKLRGRKTLFRESLLFKTDFREKGASFDRYYPFFRSLPLLYIVSVSKYPRITICNKRSKKEENLKERKKKMSTKMVVKK